MSADIDDMPTMSATACAAADVASGARDSPAMTAIASNRAMRRRKSMPYPDTVKEGLEGAPLHNYDNT